ncbi:uncharacterized protein LOC111638404 [Centruroides sculpturatus]|uniref:uncharacterized protein LOC111638404 n=1 Tax=Centruroides sculpturatus TaxID=218467 RepID=UPI000C6DBD14|nr:uncharacterized protein LOC111638404 [Centruroides sculpturatus]
MAEEGSIPKKNFAEYIFSKLPKLKPFTPENVYVYYVPLAGAFSYSAFSVTVFIPDVSSRLFSRNSFAVANSLLFNSHLGSGLYLYNRNHMQKASTYYRIMYSVYGALLFNFGSVLLWAVTKTLLPESNILRTIFALSSSFCMLTIGKEYLDFVDNEKSSSPSL